MKSLRRGRIIFQAAGKIALGHLADIAIDLVGRFSAAERADEFLLRGIPLGLGAARGTGVFLERRNFVRH
jgi:hypothetical protein